MDQVMPIGSAALVHVIPPARPLLRRCGLHRIPTNAAASDTLLAHQNGGTDIATARLARGRIAADPVSAA
jgi:hypothetical protein